MPGSEERILTTHVGSLVRPPELVPFLRAIEAGEPYDEAAHRACLAEAVAEVVRRQADAGVDIVSDGEYGKSANWAFYIHARLSGLGQRPLTDEELKDSTQTILGSRDRQAFPEFYAEVEQVSASAASRRPVRLVVEGPIAYRGQALLQRDIANLKAAVARTEVAGAFLPVVAPASALPLYDNRHYPDDESLLFALADALGEEYRAIVDAGLTLQIDDAYLPFMYEKMVPPRTLAEYRAWAELRIAAVNRALEGIPPEKARYHLCWGSWNGPHMFDVPLKDIVDLLLKVDVGAYSLESANPRHAHEWRVWQTVKLPPGRKLIPGVVSHATNIVEHPELIAERLVRLAEVVGRENVIAGTDCGFAQGPLIQRVHPTIQWAKLAAIAEGARLATERLWR